MHNVLDAQSLESTILSDATPSGLLGDATDNILSTEAADFISASGGHGIDTLKITGSGVSLDLTGTRFSESGPGAHFGRLDSIERIDITGSGANSLRLSEHAIYHMTELRAGLGSETGKTRVIVLGDSDDTLVLNGKGWHKGENVSFEGKDYQLYSSGNAEILVDGSGLKIDLENVVLSAKPVTINADNSLDCLGWDVSRLGDVNGDGIDDFIIAAPVADSGDGEVYVIFGKQKDSEPQNSANPKIGELIAAQGGFVIKNSYDFPERLGILVSDIGDINGDGVSDVAIGLGSLDAQNLVSQRDIGKVGIILGRKDGNFSDLAAGGQNDSLSGRNSPYDLVIEGADLMRFSGLGDVNGDGLDDIGIGGRQNGVYKMSVLFGGTDIAPPSDTGITKIDPFSVSASEGFVIEFPAGLQSSFLIPGWRTSSSIPLDDHNLQAAGDINGDGLGDFIVGSPWFSDSVRTDRPNAWVVFGQYGDGKAFASNAAGTLSLADLSSSGRGVHFSAPAGGSSNPLDVKISAAGDLDGDGLDDLALAIVRLSSGTMHQRGGVIFGGADGTLSTGGNLPLENLPADWGFSTDYRIHFAAAGDMNGDGIEDLVIHNVTRSAVVFGNDDRVVLETRLRSPFDIAEGEGFIIETTHSNHRPVSLGDVNSDGIDDLAIGLPFADGANGQTVIIHGRADGLVGELSDSGSRIFNIERNTDSPLYDRGTVSDGRGDGSANRLTIDAGAGFEQVWGGGSNDILYVQNAQTLDFSEDHDGAFGDTPGVHYGKLHSIEGINIADGTPNEIILTEAAVYGISDNVQNGITKLTLYVDAHDTVRLQGNWVLLDSSSGENGDDSYRPVRVVVYTVGGGRAEIDIDPTLIGNSEGNSFYLSTEDFLYIDGAGGDSDTLSLYGVTLDFTEDGQHYQKLTAIDELLLYENSKITLSEQAVLDITGNSGKALKISLADLYGEDEEPIWEEALTLEGEWTEETTNTGDTLIKLSLGEASLWIGEYPA